MIGFSIALLILAGLMFVTGFIGLFAFASRFRLLAALLMIGAVSVVFHAFPAAVESARSQLTDDNKWLKDWAECFKQAKFWAWSIMAVLSAVAALLAYTTWYDLDAWTLQPTAATATAPGHKQWGVGILFTLMTAVFAILAVRAYLAPVSQAMYDLIETAKTYDAQVAQQFHASQRRSGYTKAQITLSGQWLRNKDDYKALVEAKVAKLPPTDPAKDVTKVEVTSVTLTSRDARTWTNAQVRFDCILPKDAAKGRPDDVVKKGARFLFTVQEGKEGETEDKNQLLSESIQNAIDVHVAANTPSGGSGGAKVVTGTSPSSTAVIGKGIFVPTDPSDTIILPD